jgi:hypothetical protein
MKGYAALNLPHTNAETMYYNIQTGRGRKFVCMHSHKQLNDTYAISYPGW